MTFDKVYDLLIDFGISESIANALAAELVGLQYKDTIDANSGRLVDVFSKQLQSQTTSQNNSIVEL